MKNSKIKKMLALSAFSSVFFIGGTSASAVIRKVVSSAVGAASSSGVRKTSMGSSLSTWSSHKGKMQQIKSDGASFREQIASIEPEIIRGKFKDTLGNEIFVSVHTKTSDEGLKVNYVKSVDGEEIVVTSIGDGFYIRSLATAEEIELLDKKKRGLLKSGIDSLGRYNLIILADAGAGEDIAFQFNNGTWRSVYRDNAGSGRKSGRKSSKKSDEDKKSNIYLGAQVDINTFPDHIKNELFGDIERIIGSSSKIGFDAPETGK